MGSDLAHDFMAGERLENMILVDANVDLDEWMVVLRQRNESVVLRRMAMYVCCLGFEEGEVENKH